MKLGISDFFEDIVNFFRFQKVLGIDIGTCSIKLLEIARRGSDLVIQNYGRLETKEYLERGNAAIQTSSLRVDERETAKMLKILLREVKPKTKRVVASVPTFASFVVPLEMPLLTKEETAKSISFQARRYLPMPLGEVMLDWFKVGEFENEQGKKIQRILIAAVPKDLIKKYKIIFKSAGLKLSALEIETLALARFFPKTIEPTMIIDIGALSTSFSVVENGLLKYVGQTDYASGALTLAISRSLNISAKRAEELKKRKGIISSGGEYELAISLLPFVDVIIEESKRARDAFRRSYTKEVKKIVLTGGGSKLLGLVKYFNREIGIEIEILDPFTFFKNTLETEPVFKFIRNDFSVAAGLVLKFK